jgi:hypothetical protein
MTNGANYKRGKLYHSPWYSDICTSNPVNTHPGGLSHPFQTKNSKQSRREANQTMCISSKQTCPINLLSDGIPEAISSSTTFSVTISKTILDSITDFNPEGISKPTEAISKFNSDHSHWNTLHQESGLRQWLCEVVGEHLSSLYVAQVDLSMSSHICSKIVLGRNMYNYSSGVDSDLDGCDQSL